MTLRCLAALLVAGLVWGQAPAGRNAPTKPAAIPSYKDLKYPPLATVSLPKVETFTLPNGMKVYLLENRELPLVSGTALVRTGNLFDPKDKIGLAGITGAVLRTGGTESKTGDEIDELLENMAASVESSIGETSGSVSFSALKENVDEVLAVFQELLTRPAFRQDKLELAKTQYRSSISRRNDDASGIASREFNGILYGRDNPYGWRVEYEHLDRIGREDLVAFYKRYFFPANILLSVQGDFQAPEMRARLEKLFAGWTYQQPPVPAFPRVSATPAAGIFLAEKDDVTQTFFRVGHLGGVLRDPNYPALEVMADILGGGFSSRLFKKVRTELGYAYGIGARWGANYNHPGLFTISGSTKSASTVETIQVIRQEIERLRTSAVSDEELATSKQTVLNSFVFNFDHPNKTLSRMVAYDYHGYPRDFLFQYQKAIGALTKADILRVAREYLKPENLTVVAVGRPADFGQPLDKLGKVARIDLTIPEPKRAAARSDEGTLAGGKALLQRMQQAMGGAEKLAAVREFTQVSELQVQAGAGGGFKASQTSRWLAPGHLRQESELPFGKVQVYSDGKTGWMASPQGTQALPAALLNQVRGDLFRVLFPLLLSDRDPARQVNLVGEGAIEISDAQGNSVRVEADPRTGLPAKRIYQSSAMGGPTEVEETISEWLDDGGLKLPRRIAIRQGGKPFAEVTIREWRVVTGNATTSVEELSKQP